MFNSCQPENKYPQIELKLVFFTFFINIFIETLIKSINKLETMFHLVESISGLYRLCEGSLGNLFHKKMHQYH